MFCFFGVESLGQECLGNNDCMEDFVTKVHSVEFYGGAGLHDVRVHSFSLGAWDLTSRTVNYCGVISWHPLCLLKWIFFRRHIELASTWVE